MVGLLLGASVVLRLTGRYGPPGLRSGPVRPLRAGRDGSDEAARSRGVRLHVVHAWTLPAQAAERPFPALEEDRATWEDDEVQRLSDALRPWRGKYPEVDVLADVVLLAPEVALAHAAGNSGLVVAGRRSGRTALALLPDAGCPVMVVPV
ncbi:universal stress protein [Streptomyces chartreusis]|uniref:universal stress protein n=1 Tax=Streptomyces chartreusis TaxID=1969 RepID=UPI0035E15C0C